MWPRTEETCKIETKEKILRFHGIRQVISLSHFLTVTLAYGLKFIYLADIEAWKLWDYGSHNRGMGI